MDKRDERFEKWTELHPKYNRSNTCRDSGATELVNCCSNKDDYGEDSMP